MIPPSEIAVINRDGRTFIANYTGIDNKGDTFQYRINMPEFKFSLVVIDVTRSELREYLRKNKPIVIKPVKP